MPSQLFSAWLAASALCTATLALTDRPQFNSLAQVDQGTWGAFNQSVAGRLRDGRPLMSPCYSVYNGEPQAPDRNECAAREEGRKTSEYLADHFGGYINPNWGTCQATGAGCVWENTSQLQQCDQGSVSFKYVEVQTVDDVQKSLAFAKNHKLRLVVKNTGHDYMGRSSAPDSFGLWMHRYQPPIKLERAFVPDGCDKASGDVVTFGAGQQFGGIYEFAHSQGYRVVGGASLTVGAAGGWITGGGHSVLTNELGLGVDNVQELKVVLPNGTYITTNRCQHQDIFFALRGGGGGTFGVVIEMSTLAHPEKPMEHMRMPLAGLGKKAISELIPILVANADRWGAEGWGGYLTPTALVMATSLLHHSEALQSLQPALDFARKYGILGQTNMTTMPSAYAVLHTSAQESSASAGSIGSSRIIPRASFQGAANQKHLSSLLTDILMATEGRLAALTILMVGPAVYSENMPATDLPNGPGASAVTPAWRDGLWHVVYLQFVTGHINDPEKLRADFEDTHDIMNPLRDFTPGAGAYLNEADVFEPDYISSFWGKENYERLLGIKKRIDPDNLLTTWHGVGWETQDTRYQCYPELHA